MAKESKDKKQADDEFIPKGTIVILVLFMLTLISLWGYVYLLLIQRGVTV